MTDPDDILSNSGSTTGRWLRAMADMEHDTNSEFSKGAVSVLNAQATEETGNDRPAAPIYSDTTPADEPDAGDARRDQREDDER